MHMIPSKYNLQNCTYTVFLLIAFTILQTCKNGDKIKSDEFVRLLPKDTLYIDVLNNLKAYDYNSEKGIFLLGDVADAASVLLPPGFSPEGNKIGFIVFSNKGEVLGTFNNTGEGPEGHGIGSMSNILLEYNQIGVFTRRGFYVYDYDGNLLHRFKDFNTLGFYGQPLYKIGAYAKGKVAMSYPRFTRKVSQHWDSAYFYLDSFALMDLNVSRDTKELKEFKKYKFPQANADETTYGWAPRISINRIRNIVNVFFEQTNTLHQYDLSSGKLVQELELQPKFYSSKNNYPVNEKSKEFST